MNTAIVFLLLLSVHSLSARDTYANSDEKLKKTCNKHYEIAPLLIGAGIV
ncbi:hypothetical protein OESDEN_03162 [Oesophagostomum dentatum]|uniref:Uncharacterized protein n=1 Tax=Oesophagostomum dentatum TaxID=61180 RepID=A0A0B1TM11_OESDE|nr:hypothetical protein OESDEN_03162 [Oesophagostomum dentatum]